MARTQLKFNSRLKASTLLEVVIAMVLIMAIFGIAMMIYVNVMNSSLSIQRIQARAIMNDLLLNTAKSNENNSQSITVGKLHIEKTIKSYPDQNNLQEIEMIAYDTSGIKLGELHQVIINNE